MEKIKLATVWLDGCSGCHMSFLDLDERLIDLGAVSYTHLDVYKRQTLLNNVETFAAIAPIVRNGGAWYASIGTPKSTGTKVFALAGRVKNTGIVEVPMGITLREVVFDIGGGIIDDHPFKAVQTGGPSGGCIPAEFLDMPLDLSLIHI